MNTYIAILAAMTVIIGCGASKEAEQKSTARVAVTNSRIVNLSVLNSSDDDFAPCLAPSKIALYFTSNRSRQATDVLLDAKSKYGERLYVSDGGGANWSQPMPVQIVSDASFNTGTMSISTDGAVAYLSASYRNDGSGGTDMYRSLRAAMQWATPERIKSISTQWWDAQPAISPDGSMLVCASDREEKGAQSKSMRSQLWFARAMSGGEWSTPEKLPAPINSSSSEISPFFASDGYLYFATNRFPPDGYEIVRSKQIDGQWSEPERLASPVNSPSDDCFAFVTSDRQQIYFASNRAGGKGGFDLYVAGFPYRIVLKGSIVLADAKQASLLPAARTPIQIEDEASKEVINVVTNEQGLYETLIQPGKEYKIRIGGADCYSALPPDRVRVETPFALDTVVTRDYILPRVVFPKFELGRFNIPFFITGYYVPNTPENLQRFSDRVARKELDIEPGGKTPYIDPDDEPYRTYADSIQQIFRSVYEKIERQILPLFDKCALEREQLKIEVKGFVDPRGLAYGVYVDESVETDSMRIEKGSVMQGQSGNIKLANLRAHYTLRMIDEEMDRRSSVYRELKKQGRVIFSTIGAGIDVSVNPSLMQDPAKRRIDITLSIEKGK